MRGVRSGPLVFAAVVIMAAIAGCSQSPKDAWITNLDTKCEAMTKQFTGPLSLRKSQALPVIDKRLALIGGLRRAALKAPPRGVNGHDLRDWRKDLGDYAGEWQKMRNFTAEANPGLDTVRALTMAAIQDDAKAAKRPAQRLGLQKCAQTDHWDDLP